MIGDVVILKRTWLYGLLAIVLIVGIGYGIFQFLATEKVSIRGSKDRDFPTFEKIEHLDAADVIEESGDVKILLTTLQGIVNRKKPRIYVQQNEVQPWRDFDVWVDDFDVTVDYYEDPMEVFLAYKDELEGIIIYDPEIPDSVNVATTMAGIKKGVVSSPDLAEELIKDPYNLEVIEDLRGKFKDKLEVYTWQYENLWGEATKEMLVGLSPYTSIPIPGDNFASFRTLLVESEEVRDENNRDVYELNLTSFLGEEAVYVKFSDAFPQDGWGPAVRDVRLIADGETIVEFQAGSEEEKLYLYDENGSKYLDDSDFRFADRGNYFVYEFKPPADTEQLVLSVEMWNQFHVSASDVRPLSSDEGEPYGYLRDYAVANEAMVFWLSTNVPEEKELFEKILQDVDYGTPYLGWFNRDFEGEVEGIDLTSKHGVYVIPSDWFHNLTVFAAAEYKEVEKEKDTLEVPPLENKIYVTFTIGEGDNLQYNQNHMRFLWSDTKRGEVPINWTSTPLLYEMTPSLLNYYESTATENDLLIVGPSGAGYFSPYAWPEEHLGEFLKEGYKHLENSGMSYPYVLNRDMKLDLPLTEEQADLYEEHYQLEGLFLGGGDRMGIDFPNDSLPISYLRGVGTVKDGINLLEDYKKAWDGDEPTFISVGIDAWGMRPSDVLEITQSLDDDFVVVRGDHYFSLIKEAYDK